MTLARDLAWKNYNENVVPGTISHQWARYALSVNYDTLPPEVVHQAKRILLDTFACAIGASEAPGRPILEGAVREIGGNPEASVFGSGYQTTAINATLVNCFMVRYLDYNDMGGGGHNSESIPPILAVAEREKASGRDFLTSVVLSYEIGQRITDSIRGANLENRGWNVDCRAGLSLPAPLGKLMGLNEDQITNAIATAGAHAPSLGILDCHREEFAMAKNLRFGFVAQHCILSCLVAKGGFTGFIRIVEGDKGYNQVICNNEMDLEKLVDFTGWKILNGSFKTICQNYTTQAHILATLALVKEHDLKPEDIASVKIKPCLRDSRHVVTIPGKKYPRNTESATHSAFFGNAMVIKERALGPAQLTPEKFNDPVILDLIEKITIEADPNLEEFQDTGTSIITTKDGRVLEKFMPYPHGNWRDPLTDAEVEEKFRGAAAPHMDEAKIKNFIDTVWSVDKLANMKDLAKLMVWG
ncbi:MAG: MmgE/PrpD family protein [Chloroflexi bacterium]|nr:MmgE/PrpD family protein [Chloroflexota bacterium]